LQTKTQAQDFFKKDEQGRMSTMAAGLLGSEILKIASDIRALAAKGLKICNLTVGDFNPTEFRIPQFLEEAVIRHYKNGQTNYPPSDGIIELRHAVQKFYSEWHDLEYPEKSVLIAGGSRPIIYATYRALVNPGDTVIYPTPSWNNNHYVHMSGARGVPVACREENAFLPTKELLKDHIKEARLISLNSPLNPTGTAYTREALEGICDLVLEENHRRKQNPLYVIYDQVYWMLTFGATQHFNPVSLRPEMASYVIFVDGISKAFAATGVRVGWGVGPPDIVEKMSSMLSHVGAWAPRAEQMATSELLLRKDIIVDYHKTMKAGVQARLDLLYKELTVLEQSGLPVKAIVPMGAIYLTVQFDLIGRKNPNGGLFTSNEEIRTYLLNNAQIGVVPFQAFAHKENSGWFRLSVGAVSMHDIEAAMPRLKTVLEKTQ
jgi:aspartate aminotransferase